MRFPIVIAAILLDAAASFAADVVPLEHAHAHNDYEHERPLLDALDNGFCSVEADIWLIAGELLVAHDRDKATPGNTLQKLYLDPLLERARANGGRVYKDGPEVLLLVDIKSGAEETYTALRGALERYAEMLTSFTNDGTITKRAVRVIVSGNRPRVMMEAEAVHLAAYDGRPEDLGGGASSAFIPLVSQSWTPLFRWRGRETPMPDDERAKLESMVKRAHAEGRKVRFWAIPHDEALWDALYGAGVDLINADNLPMLRDFLLRKR